MERQEIPIRFADLRQLAATVPTYLAQKVSVEETPTLQTAIEHDFGLAGLDTESLIMEFSQKYRVDLTGFDFTEFISSEGFDSILNGCVAALYLMAILPLWLSKLFIGSLCWLLSQKLARKIWRFSITGFFSSSKQPLAADVLTTGDFVASAAAGYFVKRERVRFIIAATGSSY